MIKRFGEFYLRCTVPSMLSPRQTSGKVMHAQQRRGEHDDELGEESGAEPASKGDQRPCGW